MKNGRYEWISNDPDIQAEYNDMRRRGESHNISVMCALRKAPSLKTDATFMAGNLNGNQFAGCEKVGNHHLEVARSHGISTAGKKYLSGLARFPGDPEAWVSGRGDVSRIANERGWGVEGSVTVKRREVDPGPDVAVAEDIVHDTAMGYQRENQGLSYEDARDKAFRIRSGSEDNGSLVVADVPDEALSECPDFG